MNRPGLTGCCCSGSSLLSLPQVIGLCVSWDDFLVIYCVSSHLHSSCQHRWRPTLPRTCVLAPCGTALAHQSFVQSPLRDQSPGENGYDAAVCSGLHHEFRSLRRGFRVCFCMFRFLCISWDPVWDNDGCCKSLCVAGNGYWLCVRYILGRM